MKNNKGKVLIAAPVHPILTNGLIAGGYECITNENISQSIAFGLIKDCVGIITSTRLQLDKDLIDAAPQLQWIGRMGSGMEVIDMEYASAKGIKCFSSPEGNCNAVGEHALGMLLGLIRRIGWSNNELLNGIWNREENRGIELEGKTVGIIGYGHTGQAFAKKLKGFDTRIIAYDKYNPAGIPADVICCDTLDLIYREADIISFHVPLQPDTAHYFNERFVLNMHKPFILINTSRGTVVSLAALAAGIEAGKIVGACLDVFEQEPVAKMDRALMAIFNKLILLPNIIVTPHIAGYTQEALCKMSTALLRKIVI